MNYISNKSDENFFQFKSILNNQDNWESLDISSYSFTQTYINSRECPHCRSHNVVSKGNYKGRKRYQCRSCGKSYNDLTSTPFSGIHNLERLREYLECMIEGYSIRKAALIANVSVTTSFNWRHKLLNGIKGLPAPKMKNVKEVLEIEIPYSNKGQRTSTPGSLINSKVSAVFVCDRLGKMDSDCIISSKRDENTIFKRIAEATDEHCDIICSPKLFNNISPLEINFKYPNSIYSRLSLITNIVESWQVWMKRFHGVATKYLSNYLHWFDYLDNTQFRVDKIPDFVQLLLRH